MGRLTRLLANHLYIWRNVTEQERATHGLVLVQVDAQGFRQGWRSQDTLGSSQVFDWGWQRLDLLSASRFPLYGIVVQHMGQEKLWATVL